MNGLYERPTISPRMSSFCTSLLYISKYFSILDYWLVAKSRNKANYKYFYELFNIYKDMRQFDTCVPLLFSSTRETWCLIRPVALSSLVLASLRLVLAFLSASPSFSYQNSFLDFLRMS